MNHKSVLLIMGSTRAGRICPIITEWVARIGRSCTDFSYELVDLSQWPLPMDDEPGIPAAGGYIQPHTQAWSRKVASADAVVFVTPQYNWGYPATLKNAIDHLYKEWNGKPAAIITYGGHGGGKCAEQLRQVAGAVKMQLTSATPAITLSSDVIKNGSPIDPDVDFKTYVESVEQALHQLATFMV
ncbi:NADPH-dependent FMN reductase [Rhodanobacter sp. MP1X3]|uniref:NADPH-dependent FMN reductase n=1 Tax=Rhodanobacter sp. MP1X3 TaxID=2723086 RepID=UPI0016172B04|nr:NADPH-dependent FMN reductase [Rhodanobacter sp. MP1X3]MBB6241896.1 NAD(P)H-dependent FMN reductase [Rhodanobacter sp. MP1X3]